jgi:hypothetical protein
MRGATAWKRGLIRHRIKSLVITTMLDRYSGWIVNLGITYDLRVDPRIGVTITNLAARWRTKLRYWPPFSLTDIGSLLIVTWVAILAAWVSTATMTPPPPTLG